MGTTNHGPALDLLGGDARIGAYEQFAVAGRALISGDADGVINDDTAGQTSRGANQDAVGLLPGSLQSDPLGLTFPLDSDLVEPIDVVLDEMRGEGTPGELAL